MPVDSGLLNCDDAKDFFDDKVNVPKLLIVDGVVIEEDGDEDKLYICKEQGQLEGMIFGTSIVYWVVNHKQGVENSGLLTYQEAKSIFDAQNATRILN